MDKIIETPAVEAFTVCDLMQHFTEMDVMHQPNYVINILHSKKHHPEEIIQENIDNFCIHALNYKTFILSLRTIS